MIHHLFGSEDWYIIHHDRGGDDGRPGWMHRGLWLHSPNSEAHVEWNLFGRGFGAGFEFGRNGGESDVGLNLYLGRLASVWMRLRAPWTKWARVKQGTKNWHYARHTGIRLFPYKKRIFLVEIDNLDGYWSKDQPWWREFGLSVRDIMGQIKVDDEPLSIGTCRIPLPEGNYNATYVVKRMVWRHVRYPGKILDWFWKRTIIATDIDIPGGIPVEGKGENSYDMGMDGLFSSYGPGQLEESIGRIAASVQRDRNRYGGPHNLTRPMTVEEASL